MTRYTLLLLAGMLGAAPAAAQDAPLVSLLPEDPARWDAAGYTGWLGGNKSDIGPSWDGWYDAATFGFSVARYWTPHVKLDLDFAANTRGDVPVDERIPAPGEVPLFRYGTYRFRTTTASGGLLYQFRRNAWFHPFAGAGLSVVRESERREIWEYQPCRFLPCEPRPLQDQRAVSYRARPFATAGFKWYVTERAFVRSDAQATFSADVGVEALRWRVGIGVDLR